MSFGDPLRGRMRHGLIQLRVVPHPLMKYGFEDQDPSFFDTKFDDGISYVNSPVNSGSYALKVYTPPYPNNKNPMCVKSFLQPQKTLYFRFYFRLPAYPLMNLMYMFNVARYIGAPYWWFLNYSVRTGIQKSGSDYYFNLHDVIVGSPLSLNTWYRLEYLVSSLDALNKVQMKIDGTSVRTITYPSGAYMAHYGFVMYPTQVYPVGGQTFYVDDLATWSEDWIGGI